MNMQEYEKQLGNFFMRNEDYRIGQSALTKLIEAAFAAGWKAAERQSDEALNRIPDYTYQGLKDRKEGAISRRDDEGLELSAAQYYSLYLRAMSRLSDIQEQAECATQELEEIYLSMGEE